VAVVATVDEAGGDGTSGGASGDEGGGAVSTVHPAVAADEETRTTAERRDVRAFDIVDHTADRRRCVTKKIAASLGRRPTPP
jgi:hypothetical protein